MSPHTLKEARAILARAEKIDAGEGMFAYRITPEIAEALLRRNPNIRNIRETVVTRYAADMSIPGRWRLTGQPIILDREGNLRDGQHRLHACVRAGVPFDSFVVIGVAPDIDLNLDSGVKRQLGDYLNTHGYASGKELAASIRLAYQMIEEQKIVQDADYTNDTLIAWFFSGHAPLADDLERVKIWKRRWTGSGFTISHAAAIRHAASYVEGIDIADVDSFFEQFALAGAGENATAAPTAHALRRVFDRATGVREAKDRIQIPERMALTIRAINLYISGRPVPSTGLRWVRGGRAPEEYPQLSAGAMYEATKPEGDEEAAPVPVESTDG